MDGMNCCVAEAPGRLNPAERFAMRAEYAGEGMDPRVVILLDQLALAEAMLAQQMREIESLSSRLTRRPAVRVAAPVVRREAVGDECPFGRS